MDTEVVCFTGGPAHNTERQVAAGVDRIEMPVAYIAANGTTTVTYYRTKGKHRGKPIFAVEHPGQPNDY